MKKAVMAIIMAVLTALAFGFAYYSKKNALSDIYDDIFFTRLAVETGQYIRKIEYGLKNGKSLDNFYNIEDILDDVSRCSSYTNGVFIISEDYALVYRFPEGTAALQIISVPMEDSIYAAYKSGEEYFVTIPIYGEGEKTAGYMTLVLDERAVTNSISDFTAESLVQTAVICALSYMLTLVLIIHTREKNGMVLRRYGEAGSLSVLSGILVDFTVCTLKFDAVLEGLLQRSVSKIVMVLQNDLDSIAKKGIAYSRISDINGWLLESKSQIPFIENLIYDKNYRISAFVEEGYETERFTQLALLLAAALGVILLLGIALCVLCATADRLFKKGEQQ